MNESFPRLSLSLSSRITFYVPKGMEKRQQRQRFKPKGKGVTEKTFFFFVRFEMTGLLGCPDLECLESRRKEEGTRGEREEIGKLG